MMMPSTSQTPKNGDMTSLSFIDMSDTESPIKNSSLWNARNSEDSTVRAKIVNSTPVIQHGYRYRSNILR